MTAAQYEACCRVYFVEAVGLDLIKIGHSIDLMKRLVSLLTSSPARLFVIGSIPGGRQKEREIHVALHAHRSHGEWFRKTPEVMAIVATADQSHGENLLNPTAQSG